MLYLKKIKSTYVASTIFQGEGASIMQAHSLSDKEKAEMGQLYNFDKSKELIEQRLVARNRCFQFNQLLPVQVDAQQALLADFLAEAGDDITIMAPFHCDYGENIFVGKNFYAQYNLVILDAATVKIGDNVVVGPNCTFTTSGYPLDVEQRESGLEYAYPITIGDDVWIGANVVINPGVTIGNGAVIGSGAVVTHDIPEHVVAAGNPADVMRELRYEDKLKYQ